jgi:hypothetical protein
MKRILFLGLLMCSAWLASAQENYFYASWAYNVPLSNKEWLDSPTGYGGMAGYRFFIRESELSLGLDLGWTTFKQYEPLQTFESPGSAITTDYFKYIYNYSAVVSAQYHLGAGKSEVFFPYVGLGLGANYNDYTLYYNIYTEDYRGFGFLARPEAGFLVRFGERRSVGAIAAVHYDYSTNRRKEFNYDNFSAVGFKIGIVLMNRY